MAADGSAVCLLAAVCGLAVILAAHLLRHLGVDGDDD